MNFHTISMGCFIAFYLQNNPIKQAVFTYLTWRNRLRRLLKGNPTGKMVDRTHEPSWFDFTSETLHHHIGSLDLVWEELGTLLIVCLSVTIHTNSALEGLGSRDLHFYQVFQVLPWRGSALYSVGHLLKSTELDSQPMRNIIISNLKCKVNSMRKYLSEKTKDFNQINNSISQLNKMQAFLVIFSHKFQCLIFFSPGQSTCNEKNGRQGSRNVWCRQMKSCLFVAWKSFLHMTPLIKGPMMANTPRNYTF
jgi:hypothetical protein